MLLDCQKSIFRPTLSLLKEFKKGGGTEKLMYVFHKKRAEFPSAAVCTHTAPSPPSREASGGVRNVNWHFSGKHCTLKLFPCSTYYPDSQLEIKKILEREYGACVRTPMCETHTLTHTNFMSWLLFSEGHGVGGWVGGQAGPKTKLDLCLHSSSHWPGHSFWKFVN